MPAVVVAAIAVAVLVVIAAVAVLATTRGGPSTGRLKYRFGPEYDRALALHDGDAKATRKELAGRVERYGGLRRTPLARPDRERYTARWDAVQAQFVDEPARALGAADRLIAELAADRGFPAAGSPEHFDALSVHHARQVQGYRQAHALAEHAGAGGQGATEDLRQALVAARPLFRELLADDGKEPRGTVPAPAAASDAAGTPDAEGPRTPASSEDHEAAPEPRSIGDRFAALTGTGRKDPAEREQA